MKVFVILCCILVALNVILAKSYDKKHEKQLKDQQRSKSSPDWSSDKYVKDFGKKIMKRSPKWRNEFSENAVGHEDSDDWFKASKHSQKKPHKLAKRSVSDFDEESHKRNSKKHHVEEPWMKYHKRFARDIKYNKESKHDFQKMDSDEVFQKKNQNSNSVFREFPSHEIHVDKKSNKNSKKFEKASKKAKKLLKADDSEDEITKVASQKEENPRQSRDEKDSKNFRKNSSEESEEKMVKDQKKRSEKKDSEEFKKSSEHKKDAKKTAKRSPSENSSESIENDSDNSNEKFDRVDSKKPEKSSKPESAEEVVNEIPSKFSEIPSVPERKEEKPVNLTDSIKKVLENAPLEFTEAQKMFPSAPVLDLKKEDQANNASQPQMEAESAENDNSQENNELIGKPTETEKAPGNSSKIHEKVEPTVPPKFETDSKNQEVPLNPPVIVPGKVEIATGDKSEIQKKPQIYSSMLNTAHISATCFCSHSDRPANYTIVVFKDEIDCSSFNCAHQALHCKVEKNEVMGFTVSADQHVSKGHSSLRLSCSGFPLVREISFESTYLAEKETMVNSVETGPDNGNITVTLKVLPMSKTQFTGTRNSWSPFQIFASWFPKLA